MTWRKEVLEKEEAGDALQEGELEGGFGGMTMLAMRKLAWVWWGAIVWNIVCCICKWVVSIVEMKKPI